MGVVLHFVLRGSSGRKLHRSGQQRPDAPAAQSWVAAHGGCRLLLLLLLLAASWHLLRNETGHAQPAIAQRRKQGWSYQGHDGHGRPVLRHHGSGAAWQGRRAAFGAGITNRSKCRSAHTCTSTQTHACACTHECARVHAHLHAQARMRARAPVWVMQMMSAAPTLSAALTAPVAIDSSLCLIDTGCLRWWWCVCGQGLGLALGLGLRGGGWGGVRGATSAAHTHMLHTHLCCRPSAASAPTPPTHSRAHPLALQPAGCVQRQLGKLGVGPPTKPNQQKIPKKNTKQPTHLRCRPLAASSANSAKSE